MLEQYDELNNYCRMLGHHIPFHYCRTVQNGLPCSKILDCHFERLPIQQYIAEYFSEEQQALIFKQPEPKINTLMELIARAKNRSAT